MQNRVFFPQLAVDSWVIEGRAELDDLHHQLSTIAHDDPAMEEILERSGELQTWLDDAGVRWYRMAST